MPARKKMYKKRRTYNKRKPFSRKQVRAIQKIAQHSSELKTANSESLNNTNWGFGAQVNMVSIAQGDGDGERIGSYVICKFLGFKLIFINFVVSSPLASILKILL